MPRTATQVSSSLNHRANINFHNHYLTGNNTTNYQQDTNNSNDNNNNNIEIPVDKNFKRFRTNYQTAVHTNKAANGSQQITNTMSSGGKRRPSNNNNTIGKQYRNSFSSLALTHGAKFPANVQISKNNSNQTFTKISNKFIQ